MYNDTVFFYFAYLLCMLRYNMRKRNHLLHILFIENAQGSGNDISDVSNIQNTCRCHWNICYTTLYIGIRDAPLHCVKGMPLYITWLVSVYKNNLSNPFWLLVRWCEFLKMEFYRPLSILDINWLNNGF